MAGFGALLGALPVLKAALWVAGIGGVLAIGVVGARSLRKALRKALRKTPAQEAPGQEAEDEVFSTPRRSRWECGFPWCRAI